jgi:hypothetical protein
MGKLKKDKSDEVGVETTEKPVYNKVSETLVKVQSLLDARLVYSGQATGKRYEWTVAGSIVSVAYDDVQQLLAKEINAGCCGGRTKTKIFQIVK